MGTLETLLDASASRHSHLCPRQVIGVRMSLLAGRLLELDVPRTDKRLLVIVETDGCAADGVGVAAGCSVGRRTLRVEDYGKVAATYVDTADERAVRIWPQSDIRMLAGEYAPAPLGDRWESQLIGYQRMPDEVLLSWDWVQLRQSIHSIVSEPGLRVACGDCGEEIMNAREIVVDGRPLCRGCAGHAYYIAIERPVSKSQPVLTSP